MENEPKKLNNESYFQVPKSLFKMRWNNEISIVAFDIYILMLDRFKLSMKNNWIDEEGNIFINYSYEELLEDLNIKKKNIVSEGLKELEELNFIIKKRRQRKSTLFYLKSYSNQVVTSKKSYSNQNVTFKNLKVTDLESYSNQVVTSKSEKNTQKDIGNKEENEGEKAPNKNNISNNKYISNNNNVINYINNKNYINIDPGLKNEIHLLLKDRDIRIKQITDICIDIRRIEEVIKYADKYSKGNGFILKALRENWQLGLDIQASCESGLDIQADSKNQVLGLDIQANTKTLESRGQKDYSMSLEEALKRSRGKK